MNKNIHMIKIPQLKLFGYHGCYDEEKEKGQTFEINMEIAINMSEARDSLKEVLDYVSVINKIKKDFIDCKCDLLETLSANLSSIPFDLLKGMCEKDFRIEYVTVKVKKFSPKGMDVPYIQVEHIRYAN